MVDGQANKVLQLTICPVTARACARSAPSQLAAEKNVMPDMSWLKRQPFWIALLVTMLGGAIGGGAWLFLSPYLSNALAPVFFGPSETWGDTGPQAVTWIVVFIVGLLIGCWWWARRMARVFSAYANRHSDRLDRGRQMR